MRSVFKLLGIVENERLVRDPETVERIARELSAIGPRARYVAALAFVLARVAHADHDISPEEIAVMGRLVEEAAELPKQQAVLVVEIARSQALALGSNENYVVTRLYRELSTRAQRLGLLECLFAVAAADENISTAENHEISVIASEFGLLHDEVTRVRAAYRQHLAVLKDLPRAGGAGR
jgi:uncharacterized tellurite resistance protein B-like protein